MKACKELTGGLEIRVTSFELSNAFRRSNREDVGHRSISLLRDATKRTAVSGAVLCPYIAPVRALALQLQRRLVGSLLVHRERR